MRELRPAIHPLLGPVPAYGAVAPRAFPLSRTALITSIGVHLVGAYMVGLIVFRADDLPPVIPSADFVWLDARILPPSTPQLDEPRVIEAPPVEVEPENAEPPAAPLSPPTRSVEEVPPIVEPAPPEPIVETESPRPVAPSIDFETERRRAAAEVVEQREREREGNYLTFSIRDVAPERPVEEPEVPSIFDGSGASAPRGPTVGRLGQTKTRFGARMAALCNALSSGGFSLMGWGSFCASPDDEPSGLFPEVMPEYLTLKPECVETRPLAAELGEDDEFPTIKCELVPRVEVERWAFPDEPLFVDPIP